MMREQLKKRIFSITSRDEFEILAMEIFRYQAEENLVYKEFLDLLEVDPAGILSAEQIPFLPVELFKTHRVICGKGEPERIFESSGTSSAHTSKHYVRDLSIYRTSLESAFRLFYGDPSRYCILALLPSYLERQNSSLVFMADQLIRLSEHPQSGFYLDHAEELFRTLQMNEKNMEKTLLLGVSFALLDLAEKFPAALKHTLIMETGGMKGRREELTRNELHSLLGEAFLCRDIHSEYGMTELFSQAYSRGNGIYQSPPWMQVMIRDIHDPLSLLPEGRPGGISIIDLANLDSCSFIATQDIGRILPRKNSKGNPEFEVLGRFDNSDIRGCNLLVE